MDNLTLYDYKDRNVLGEYLVGNWVNRYLHRLL